MLQPQYEDPTEHLWSLAWGRNISRFLGLAIELDALGKMGEEPITVTEASVRWGLPETSARVLAQSLCCMRILVHKNGLLTKSELAQNLAAGGFLLDECRKPLESIDVLKGELQSPKPQAWYQIRDDGQAPDDSTLNPGFYRKLHPIRLTWGEQLAGRYDFSGHRELIDIGGASVG